MAPGTLMVLPTKPTSLFLRSQLMLGLVTTSKPTGTTGSFEGCKRQKF